MNKQAAKGVVMIRPAAFGYNRDTAGSNSFQQQDNDLEGVQAKAVEEFNDVVATLNQLNIEVLVYEDNSFPQKPDAIFPNNWFCTLPDGVIALFPMMAPSRSDEKRMDIIEDLSIRYKVAEVEDWSRHEVEEQYLEGTGSMVIDYCNRIIYACRSPRTNEQLLTAFADSRGYSSLVFNAVDKSGLPIYHTNVLMCVADCYAVVCKDVFSSEIDYEEVKRSLEHTGHEVVNISYEQMKSFAGNALQVESKDEVLYLLLSQNAYESLNAEQKQRMEAYNQLVPLPIPTIERVGGGSIRCMMANIHLPG